MSTPNRVKAKDLVEDGKKRIVFLVICAVGLSYLMSLTSSSVWVNLPVATCLVITLRYLLLNFEMKRKAVAYNSRPCKTAAQSSKKPFEPPKVVARPDWREKVNSPVVEEAMDRFTRRLVSEWVTNLWYSRLTPDREGPEELVQIILGVLGEISGRIRNINLIDLLISDLINLICTHLEVFRATLAKIEEQNSSSPLTTESRDTKLKLALAAEDKLHPALFSAEAEHKVLQHLMEGLMSVTFKYEDLQCSFIQCTARELLAHAVMRPVLNLASPRFLNERIEYLVINKTKVNKGANAVQEASHSTEDRLKISSDRFTKLLDSSISGLELVQLGSSHSRNAQSSVEHIAVDTFSKDPLRSIDAILSLLWKSLPSKSQNNDNQGVKQYQSGGQCGDILDLMSQRKTQALAPEHFESMWTKGRNFESMDEENQSSELVLQHVVVGKLSNIDHKKAISGPKEKETNSKLNSSKGTSANLGCSNRYTVEDTPLCADRKRSTCSSVTSFQDDDQSHMRFLMVDSGSSTSYTSEDDETRTINGVNSPGTKVWDGRRDRDRLIHHPLECLDSHSTKMNKIQPRCQRLPRTRHGWKMSSGQNMQEVKKTSFLSGDRQDILMSSKSNVNSEDFSQFSDDLDIDNLGRIHSGAASSSAPSISRSESCSVAVNPLKSSLPVDSFSKLRCEVLGANIVKSGSRTFAVYSISITDVNNRSWTIKRRYRHFEELHQRLKEFPDYNLHLPSKHFLSTGLDVAVVQERCKLLDIYLKKLMQLPIVSGSIEAWDFLSIDSQTYRFSNLLSVVKTLSVDVDDKPSSKSKSTSDFSVWDIFASRRENNVVESNEAVIEKKSRGSSENSGIDTSTRAGKSEKTQGKEPDGSTEVSDFLHDASDALPTEWVPPNLSVPILDLVDVIFQLQDGGWIRRKTLWVVKQILQLGMGDAFDDWLLDKIQLLRKGSVIASGIKRVEQILWPDGIFITKHPSRRPTHGQKPKDVVSQRMDDKRKQEEDRRAKFVYELMIDQAPTAIVGLVGSKEYEQCVRNLYFFLQSSVCLKQLAFDLVELLMVTAFPELDHVCKQLHEDMHKFGELNKN